MDSFLTLAKEFLPQVMVDYFEITNYKSDSSQLNIYLDEKNIPPVTEPVLSKGFHPVVKVQDFPIRGKQVYLHIRRRRWKSTTTNESISRDWQLIAKGTRMTQEFAECRPANFLKEISR